MNIKKKGFTLIELLVVVAIISMLTSVTLSSLNDAKQKGRDTGKIRALQEVRKALQNYATEKGGFPGGTAPSTQNYLPNELVNGNTKYISQIDPSIIYRGVDSNGAYCSSAQQPCASYHISIVLEKRDNKVLKSDIDSTKPTNLFKIYGKGDDCTLDQNDKTSSPELCYDLEP